MIRLNKYMSEAGICSRREADRLVEQGRVTVNKETAVVGMQIEDGYQVELDGRPIRRGEKDETVLIAVNKPKGIVCSEVSQGGDTTIIEFLKYPKRITYAGRLDKESEGLLLMTNRGELINQMMRASNYHEKEYEVVVNRPVHEEFLRRMADGVYLKELGVTTSPCTVERLGKRKFRIVLTQGLNRQIRRMCRELGFHVQELCRVRIMNIHLGRLKTGAWRNVTGEELEELLQLLKASGKQSGKMEEWQDDEN